MDLRSLRYFQVVAECGSLSRGAALLRISQPAVSRAIRLLEEDCHQQLFVRHGHGVSLTEPGERLLKHVRTILQTVTEARSDVSRSLAGGGGTLRLALPPAVGAVIAPRLAQRMKQDMPGVTLEFIGGFSGYIHELIAREQVDLACLHDPQPQRDLVIRPLARDQVFLVGHSSLLPALERATIHDLAALPLLLPSGANASRRVLTAWSATTDLWMQPHMTVDDHMILRSLLRAGEGVSLLTRGAFGEDQRAGLLTSLPLSPAVFWTLCLVHRQRESASPAVTRCMEILTSLTRELIATGVWLPLPKLPKED